MAFKRFHPYIPPESRTLHAGLSARDAPWTSPAQVAALVDAFAVGVLGPIREMRCDDYLTWEAFDRSIAIERAWAGPNRSVGLRWSEQPWRSASIAQDNRGYHHVVLTLAPAAVAALSLAALETEVARLAAALPNFAFGEATADHGVDYMELRLTRKVPLPLSPFELGRWLTIVPARSLDQLISREALLATPATAVREDANGTIWLKAYDDPFAYDSDEAYAQTERVGTYLREHQRRDVVWIR